MDEKLTPIWSRLLCVCRACLKRKPDHASDCPIAALKAENAKLKQQMEALEAFKRSVDVALNSGDGAYRP